jgi:quinol monooxygenase YgiN
MIIVSGKIYVIPGRRDLFLERSLDAIKAARQAKGCRDFVVAADPVEPDRVNIYEEWESEADLAAFRGAGPDSDLSSLITDAKVAEHRIATDDAWY